MANKQLNSADWTGGSWDPVNDPVADDAVTIPDTLSADVIDSGAAADGIDLDLLWTHPLFTRNFGTSATPIVAVADRVEVLGSGGFYFLSDKGGAALKTDLVMIDPTNPQADIQIGSNPGDAGAVLDITALAGNVLIKGNIIFESGSIVRVGRRIGAGAQVMVTIGSGISVALPELVISNGRVKCSSVVTKVTVAGELTQDTAKAVTIDILEGGKVTYNHAAVTGEVLLITIYPGATLDMMQSSHQKVIDKVVALPGSTVHYNDQKHTFTIFDDRRT